MSARKTASKVYSVPCPGCGKPVPIVCGHGAIAVSINPGVTGEGDS